MDAMITAVINGKIKPLHYSIEVMFAVNEKYGSVQNALDVLQHDNREGFDCLRYLAVAMANDAELCRRAEGYDSQPMTAPEEISTRMDPIMYIELKNAVTQAIGLGYKRELDDENKETDLGLLELQKKEEAGA